MPVFDFLHWNKAQGDLLEETGPLIQVVTSMPPALEEFCIEKGLEIPAPVSGYALVDTGASATSVHEPILQQLSVLPIDSIPSATPSGQGRSFVYPAKVSFPTLNVSNMRMDRVLGCELNWQTADGKTIVMLLGRDLLKYFLMVYNGPSSSLTLAF